MSKQRSHITTQVQSSTCLEVEQSCYPNYLLQMKMQTDAQISCTEPLCLGQIRTGKVDLLLLPKRSFSLVSTLHDILFVDFNMKNSNYFKEMNYL